MISFENEAVSILNGENQKSKDFKAKLYNLPMQRITSIINRKICLIVGGILLVAIVLIPILIGQLQSNSNDENVSPTNE